MGIRKEIKEVETKIVTAIRWDAKKKKTRGNVFGVKEAVSKGESSSKDRIRWKWERRWMDGREGARGEARLG